MLVPSLENEIEFGTEKPTAKLFEANDAVDKSPAVERSCS